MRDAADVLHAHGGRTDEQHGDGEERAEELCVQGSLDPGDPTNQQAERRAREEQTQPQA
jgi:hypothetical protein